MATIFCVDANWSYLVTQELELDSKAKKSVIKFIGKTILLISSLSDNE
jgi:hypothetical protein